MLTAYFEAAMRMAGYELMENGEFYGSVPKCRGAWGHGKTLEECRLDLRGALESWVLGGLHHGDRIPLIDGINVNPPRSRRKPSAALAHA